MAEFIQLLVEQWQNQSPAEVVAAAPRLRLVQKIGVGVNTIDLDAARRRGIAVCNLPGTNTRAVAEMTLLLMLGALRRVSRLDGNEVGRAHGSSPAATSSEPLSSSVANEPESSGSGAVSEISVAPSPGSGTGAPDSERR